jgi:hypothetical protein
MGKWLVRVTPYTVRRTQYALYDREDEDAEAGGGEAEEPDHKGRSNSIGQRSLQHS